MIPDTTTQVQYSPFTLIMMAAAQFVVGGMSEAAAARTARKLYEAVSSEVKALD